MDELLQAYSKTFDKYEALKMCGLPVSAWDKYADDEQFQQSLQQISMAKAEQIKSELILKTDKSVNEIKYALELLGASSGKQKVKTPGKHSKSLSGNDKRAIFEAKKELIADE